MLQAIRRSTQSVKEHRMACEIQNKYLYNKKIKKSNKNESIKYSVEHGT